MHVSGQPLTPDPTLSGKRLKLSLKHETGFGHFGEETEPAYTGNRTPNRSNSYPRHYTDWGVVAHSIRRSFPCTSCGVRKESQHTRLTTGHWYSVVKNRLVSFKFLHALRSGRSRDRIPVEARFFAPVHTCPASDTVSAGSLSRARR